MDSYKTIIEIGSFSIKTIIYSKLNNEFSIIGTGKTRSTGYSGEEVENFDDFIDSIKNSIVQAENKLIILLEMLIFLLQTKAFKLKKHKRVSI